MRLKTRLLSFGVMAAVSAALPGYALAQAPAEQVRTVVTLDIPAGPAAAGLNALATQADVQLFYPFSAVRGRSITAVKGEFTRDEAIQQMAQAAGLRIASDDGRTVTLEDPQGGSAAAGGAEVEALIVTAQKREEDIQDVPIAISAFTQEDLTRSQIAGGPDLMTQIPNFTFTKTNFAGYSIQIRGIGTQAISATTDPAVAVAFNNTPFVRNRFFEQEFYDLQRVEVLRGPQGTLYGRNATAGVVNIISAKPKFIFESKLSGDVSNYNSTRLEGMVNIPLVEDAVALRLAGAWTKRDGYVTNEITGNPIDGRDLWSTRVSLRFAPSNAPFDVNLIWEHFEEDDDRLRSGKQLCKKHRPEFLTAPDGTMVPIDLSDGGLGGEAQYNQGCERVSLYSPDAFQTPNGEGIPYYRGLQGIGLALRDVIPGNCCTDVMDPYLSTVQSRDLRVIESTVDPEYRANTDIVELQASFDVTDSLTLTSETAYSSDELFSLQDLNRFNTTPGVFAQHASERANKFAGFDILTPGPNGGGIFCDPQIGCSDRLVAMDLSTAESTQFSQEFRLGSDFDGPFNFSLGANFLRTDTIDKYYVFINTVTLTSFINPLGGNSQAVYEYPPYVPNVSDNRECRQGVGPWHRPDPTEIQSIVHCIYTDPNPIGSLNDKGHNYFLSKNPYKLISYAAFGEAYYQLADNLKITGGLRWTVDKKEAPRIPSMLLAANTLGYTVETVVEQEWREPTGRLALDWKPDLAFTDETMVYASYAHGYKAGGANPPPTAVATYGGVGAAGRLDNYATFPRTFEPEFIDAFELGAKNTLFDGTVTLNTAAFYYDYKNYQVSEIVDRAALNRNFDATVWGVEIEADWRPIENLKLSFKGGYEKTEIGDGEQAIDLMDRTAGDPNWVVLKPFPASPSNCVLPTWLATWGGKIFNGWDDWGACVQVNNGLDPVTRAPYVPNPVPPAREASSGGIAGFWNGYPGYDPRSANNSQGLFKQLGGNELPNAPNWTATLSGDYTLPLAGDWLAALHADIHWQSKSWWRVFNDHEYNKLDEFYLINMAAIFTNEEAGWNVMAYVKNVLDEDALTGAFLFSDDTGLTTNVFLTEPRLYGLRVTKAWSGGPLLGSFGQRRDGPYPFEVELGGQILRHDAPYQSVAPSFTDEFSEALDPLASQRRDLDWGDGREVKLSYRPNDAWKASLSARFGKANGYDESFEVEDSGHLMCYQVSQPSYQINCGTPTSPVRGVDNHSETTVRNEEEYAVVDFEVGRDFAIGGLDSSQFGLGLRYARLQSLTEAHIMGTPDWYLPPRSFYKYAPFSWAKYDARHTDYEARLTAEREFEGAGPVLSWDASRSVLGNRDLGHLNIDASISGGVLFGEQETRITGEEIAEYLEHPHNNTQFWTVENTPGATRTITPVDIHRSESVSVPLLDLSLGLSYQTDRMKIGAGYRWERYFDAIDGGYDEHQDADRTIDGPYFRLSVGFGG